jgi:hypothetical protein
VLWVTFFNIKNKSKKARINFEGKVFTLPSKFMFVLRAFYDFVAAYTACAATRGAAGIPLHSHYLVDSIRIR